MNSHRTRTSVSRFERDAFTLVEIMVAIVIIAILMSLLLPALGRARTTARIQEVKTDMDKITTAIAQFKMRFNADVPGSVTLLENPAQWTSHPDGPRSRGIIRQFWPTFQFDIAIDFNNNGVPNEVLRVDGAESLVFFLGGMRDPTTGALTGFSKNPTNPFALGGNREGPFFEFKGSFVGSNSSSKPAGRLIDTDGDLLAEYLDPIEGQSNPYLYFANGYRIADDGFSKCANADNWVPGPGPDPSQRMKRAYYLASVANQPYPAGAALSVPHNKSTFQIISPGFDYQYGNGGGFDPNDDAKNTDLSKDDSDNITNFHSGTLR